MLYGFKAQGEPIMSVETTAPSPNSKGFNLNFEGIQQKLTKAFGQQAPAAVIVVSQVALCILSLTVSLTGSGLALLAAAGAVGCSVVITGQWMNHADRSW